MSHASRSISTTGSNEDTSTEASVSGKGTLSDFKQLRDIADALKKALGKRTGVIFRIRPTTGIGESLCSHGFITWDGTRAGLDRVFAEAPHTSRGRGYVLHATHHTVAFRDDQRADVSRLLIRIGTKATSNETLLQTDALRSA